MIEKVTEVNLMFDGITCNYLHSHGRICNDGNCGVTKDLQILVRGKS